MKVIEKILWNKVIREAEYDKKEMEECVTKFQKLRVEPYERLVKRLKSLSKVLHLMGIHTLKYRNFDYLKYDRKGLVELIKLYVNRIKPRYYETLNDQEFQRLKDTLDFDFQPRNADNFDDDDFFYESSTISSVKSEALDCKIISDEVNSVDL
ncbi:unnamed protein product [Rhizophagus irregularis]|nr:unnamed protein product [Rhizophagus irregularis]